MNWFFTAFRICLLRRLRSRGNILFVLLALILSAGVLFFTGGQKEAAVQVGLVLPEGEGKALEALLQERSSQLVTFLTVDEQTLDRQILAGNFDCGLVLSGDFDRRIRELDTDGILTLKTGPASTVYPLVQETAAACMMELMSPYMAERFMEDRGMSTRELLPKLEELSRSTQRVRVKLKTLEGEAMAQLNLMSEGSRKLLRGLMGLLALVWSLYLGVDLGRWLESDGARRLRAVRSVTALLLPQLAAAQLPMTLWGMALQLCMGGGLRGALAYLGLMCALLGLALLLSRIRPLWQAIPVFLPFAAVACLLVEPVLLDSALLFPRLAQWTAWLPVTLYGRCCEGSLPAAAALPAEMLLLLAASCLMDRRKGKSTAAGCNG